MIANHKFTRSEALLERACRTIPLGTQTFSKSPTQFPLGVSPYFIKRGKGSKVEDVDGNTYVDFINALAAITLGYNDPDVTAAVTAMLEDGTIFSLAHPVEMEVAERIVEMVPCAEKVRFGKNGSDATAGCVRLARGFTRRDRIAVCGYHGWQDWYIGSTTRNLGVPQATQDLTVRFAYNDIESLAALFRKYPGEIAGVIMEPMNAVHPKQGFLESVKELAHANGALLIFDETITGFRFSNGGAQEMLGVTPDLASFGKGLANGYPVSAVTGRADVMKLMEEVFFSFTYGGETLSLAAAGAVLDKLKREPVVETLKARGTSLVQGVDALIAKHGVGHFLSTSGDPAWSFLNMKDTNGYDVWTIKTLFLQETIDRGILALGTHNMSYAHTEADVASLLDCYDAVFPILRDAIDNRKLEPMLRCDPLKQLFTVR